MHPDVLVGAGHLLLTVQATADRLAQSGGGYEVVHTSPGLELGVYVLCAPDPDDQGVHEDDEVYYLIEGDGSLLVAGERVPLRVGEGIFVPSGVPHRFEDYSVLKLLVVFQRSA